MSRMWRDINAVIAGEDNRHRASAEQEAIKARTALDQATAIREDASAAEQARFMQAQRAEESFFKEYGGEPPLPPYEYLGMGGIPYEQPMCNWVSPLDYDEGMG